MSTNTQNNTPVRAETVVTLNGAQLLQALDFIAPDRDTDPQQLECELTISFADGPVGGGYYCYCTDYPDEGAIMLDAEATSAPVAAQAQPQSSRPGAAPRNSEILDLAISEGMTAKDGVYCGSAATILCFAGALTRGAALAQQDADPLQGAADWLVKDCGVSDGVELAGRLSIGHNRASRLIDAARKEPGQ